MQCEQRKHLLESFRIIAGSLGFRAKIYKSGNMYTLSIIGSDIEKIPVKVARKQITCQKRVKNTFKIHNIEVKHIGKGPFCGWNIDKNERFLLGDFTITHNTRLLGGKDAGSERYIYTQLNSITRKIFPVQDDAILEYLDDDGLTVEPIYYVPIIPMILVNGTKGIGTGFSTDIMCYNPNQIIDKLICMLKNKKYDEELHPYYKGFKGTIEKIDSKKYLIKGCYKVIDNKVKITELPIGTWTQDYKEFIEGLIDPKKKDSKPLIKDYNDMSTDTCVDFTIEFYPGVLKGLDDKVTDISGNCSEKVTELEKLLKLYTTHSTNNMHLFDEKEHLKKFNSAEEIIEAYYPTRLKYYKIRKDYQLEALNNELLILSNKARYITETLNDNIDLRRKKKEEIENLLTKLKFDKDPNNDNSYNYLIKMPMDSVSEEAVQKLLNDKEVKENEVKSLSGKTIENLWLEELKILKNELCKI